MEKTNREIRALLSSMAPAREAMRRQLRDMLDDADDDTIRSAIQRCMDAVEG